MTTPAERLRQTMIDAAGDDDWLVSFARRADTKDLFVQIMDSAKTAQPEFYARMRAAKVKANTLGDCPLFSPVNLAYLGNAILAAGVMGTAWEVEQHRRQLLHWFAGVFHVDLSDPPPAPATPQAKSPAKPQ